MRCCSLAATLPCKAATRRELTLDNKALATIRIERRFRGPPNSGNGGYSAGRLAAYIDGSVEVTLHKPPPLQQMLTVDRIADGSLRLIRGIDIIATAKPAEVVLRELARPLLAEAEAAAQRTFPASRHPVPGCFVCGPGRSRHDGLRLHVGPLDAADTGWTGALASPWRPDRNLADDAGLVRGEFVWSALDCPTAYACASADGMPFILLGRQTVDVKRRPRAGELCIVVAQSRGGEGRKHFADACLYGEDGERIASGNAVWISVAEEVLNGTV